MLEAGSMLGHFKIVRKLGEGGMGQVFLAEDTKLSRKVAIKVLSSGVFDDARQLERFTREATTAAKISSPNVMAIHDLSTHTDPSTGDTTPYIVMEFIEGATLTEYLRSRQPAMNELLRIAEKVASGLAAAHKLGIVHRDIKADNIMIDGDGQPKILDFGLAKPTVQESSGKDVNSTQTVTSDLTQEGKVVGTIHYMSPEQARGEAVDARSDIFSFGMLLYRLFTGDFPFEASDRVSIVAKILEAKQVPMREKNATLPAELDRIVDKCLQKDPNERYQDTRDLVVDLRSLRRQFESGISDSASMITEAAKAKSSLPWRRWVAGAVALVAIGIAWWQSDRRGSVASLPEQTGLPIRENGLAVLGFENKTGDAELDWMESGLPEILLTDLAQSGSINLISRSRLMDCLEDSGDRKGAHPTYQEFVKAARSLGAKTVLSGSYFKMGDRIRIDARLEDVQSGKVVLGEKVVGEDPFTLVDSLTQKIALSLDMHEMLSGDQRVADVTSSSPEAYKHYILGMRYFGNIQFDSARTEFEKALQIDSTFALPYLRIALSYAMRGRAQQGAPYFMKAQEYGQHLPVKDKRLLDIYLDLLLRQQWDDGIAKLAAFVKDYPDDKEIRSIHGILLSQMGKDDMAAMAQLDTALMIDPDFVLALTFYSSIASTREDYETALEYALKIRRVCPDAPETYAQLTSIYLEMGRYKDAIAESEALLRIKPDDITALNTIFTCYTGLHEFAKAREVVEKIKKAGGDDPYALSGYHMQHYRIDLWEGQFRSGIKHLYASAEEMKKAGDSSGVTSAYSGLANLFVFLHWPDSAVAVLKQGDEWTTILYDLTAPLALVEIDRKYEAETRPRFENGLRNFRARLPEQMWGLADLLEADYNAWAKADTAELIRVAHAMVEQGQSATSNLSESGRLLVELGKYQEAIKDLERITQGKDESISASRYIGAIYYLGRAYEGIGRTDEAKRKYEEVLRYWGKTDIPVPLVSDTRERLARLSS